MCGPADSLFALAVDAALRMRRKDDVDKAEHDAEGEHPQFCGHGDGVSRKLPTATPAQPVNGAGQKRNRLPCRKALLTGHALFPIRLAGPDQEHARLEPALLR